MTRQALTERLKRHQLFHTEKSTRKTLTLEVYTLLGWRFLDGPHSQVFHWHSGTWKELREEAWSKLTLQVVQCETDCECGWDEK